MNDKQQKAVEQKEKSKCAYRLNASCAQLH